MRGERVCGKARMCRQRPVIESIPGYHQSGERSLLRCSPELSGVNRPSNPRPRNDHYRWFPARQYWAGLRPSGQDRPVGPGSRLPRRLGDGQPHEILVPDFHVLRQDRALIRLPVERRHPLDFRGRSASPEHLAPNPDQETKSDLVGD